LGGNVECVRLLLEAGADVNARDDPEEEGEEGGEASGLCTPLHLASERGNAECVVRLLEAGADVDAREQHGSPPLHFACWWGRSECTRLLLEAGADTSVKDNDGDTSMLRFLPLAAFVTVWQNDDMKPYGETSTWDVGTEASHRLVRRATRLREERGVPAGAPLPLDWTESTHHLLADADKGLLARALGALLLVDARREGGATLGREGALAVVAAVARAARV
jgi:hypothetical protein